MRGGRSHSVPPKSFLAAAKIDDAHGVMQPCFLSVLSAMVLSLLGDWVAGLSWGMRGRAPPEPSRTGAVSSSSRGSARRCYRFEVRPRVGRHRGSCARTGGQGCVEGAAGWQDSVRGASWR